jgi:uncharacterized 2Fe-2S/4Fe-4S cluster protein (DUF4445 family)
MSEAEHLAVFMPSGKRGRFPAGTKILDAARSLGVDIDSVCGGRAMCGRCQIELSEGVFAKHGISSSSDHLSEQGQAEIRYGEIRGLDPERRLSCQTKILGDVLIDVPADSQVHHQVVRKDLESHDINIDPVLHLYFVEVEQAELDKAGGELQRLIRALQEQWELDDLTCPLQVTASIPAILRESKWQVTVAIRNGNTIAAIWPGLKEHVYGIALDIGSTTLAAHLCNLDDGAVLISKGMMNPQIRFGEDLMSRVSYCMQNPGSTGKLTEAIRQAINQLITEASEDSKIDANDILEMTVVGNPVMHHLFLGLDPVPLGLSPFTLATDAAVSTTASVLGIALNPQAQIYTLPCIAGHVGADAAAVMLAEVPYNDDAISLIVDVGTNAEIILGNRQRLLAASSPTGPAFEGAQISGGQRAAPGAIERVRIDPETLEPRFKVIGCDLWSNDPGFSETTMVTGICGSGIIEIVAEMFLTGIVDADGLIKGELADKTERLQQQGRTWSYLLHAGEPEIRILQTDIRAIQLAKAALYAGARLLMDKLGVEKIDRIRLAGAFGSHIDVKYAMILGMLPDCDLDNVSAAGNAAGTGARIALLNKGGRKEIENRVRQVEKIETAVEEKFQQHFVEAMALPHKTDPYINLSKRVTLPKKDNADTKPRRRRNRKASSI